MKKKYVLFFCVFFFSVTVFAQSASSREKVPDALKTALQNPASLVGITLADLFANYGAPRLVYPVRGLAAWQDDVVFVYDGAEFFISGNRVWQLKIQSFGSFKTGDPKAHVVLAEGQGQDFEGYSLFRLAGRVWPMMLRVNWDAAGRTQAIYVYRSDF